MNKFIFSLSLALAVIGFQARAQIYSEGAYETRLSHERTPADLQYDRSPERPGPGPHPGPHPEPHPGPHPGPHPEPHPGPHPGPHPEPHPGPHPEPHPGPYPPYPPPGYSYETIYCGQNGGAYEECYFDPRGVREVSLSRQVSHTYCDYDVNYGIYADRVWVQDGCRAEFTITRYY